MGELSPLKGLRCLVTGGSGFIGATLLRRLQAGGATVMAPSSTELDVTRMETAEECFTTHEPDVVFHLAAKGVRATSSPGILHAVNAKGAANVVKAASRCKSPPRLVMAGSSFEYAPLPRPLSEDDDAPGADEYGTSKAEGRVLAKACAGGLSCFWLRPFNVYGAGEPLPRLLPYLVDCALNGKVADVTEGLQMRDYLRVEDLAECMVRTALIPAAHARWELMNLGSGSPMSVRDFIKSAAAALEARRLPLQVRYGGRPSRSVDEAPFIPDVSKMRRLLGWMPETKLEQGVDSAIGALVSGRG